jgi:hypothetical protein
MEAMTLKHLTAATIKLTRPAGEVRSFLDFRPDPGYMGI